MTKLVRKRFHIIIINEILKKIFGMTFFVDYMIKKLIEYLCFNKKEQCKRLYSFISYIKN